VRVPELCRLEAHPTVWHLTSEVTGTLREDVGHGALLRATFPCGSITGAPKLAARALIERLEPVTRGFYCGAVGLLGAGHASWSVAIRTAVRHGDGTVDHAVGAGIVAGSDPAAEHAETLAKGAAFLRAVGGEPVPWVTGVTGRSGRSPRASRAAG
jgi:para-aminobenzoate synthetase component 1